MIVTIIRLAGIGKRQIKSFWIMMSLMMSMMFLTVTAD
jgi:hypothetical protein